MPEMQARIGEEDLVLSPKNWGADKRAKTDSNTAKAYIDSAQKNNTETETATDSRANEGRLRAG